MSDPVSNEPKGSWCGRKRVGSEVPRAEEAGRHGAHVQLQRQDHFVAGYLKGVPPLPTH